MRFAFKSALCLLAAVGAVNLVARPVRAETLDCPMASQPFSSALPLIDLMLNPQARDVLDRDGFLAMLPAWKTKTTPPTFAAILSLRGVMTPKPAPAGAPPNPMVARLDALDKDLAAIPVTRADKVARCARYDDKPPTLPVDIKRPAILVFDKINGFRDDASVNAATQALKDMAARRGWTLVFSENGAVFNARDLKRFDAVLWNNVSGDALTLHQRAAFKSYIEHGGGFVGIHGSGGDPVYFWDWYADTLIGARFAGHPHAPQFQEAQVVVDDPQSAIVAALNPGWRMTEEWYSFKSDPRSTGAHILLKLDESTYQVPPELTMGDHPIAWTKCIGNGRSFYTALGHRPESYVEPHTVSVIEAGITWAMRQGATQCASGKEVPSATN